MKKIILATVLAGLGSTAALAADMGARTPYTKAPTMMAPVASWAGFYIGGNVGYGWGDGKTDFGPISGLNDFSTHDTKPKGVLGGAQIGYNWQMGSLFTGLETDIQGSGIKGSARSQFVDFEAGDPNDFQSSNHKLSWFGTVRGRLGLLASPDIIIYGTGGLAYGGVDHSANTHLGLGGGDVPASFNKTRAGWTAGAGAEWMFTPGWSVKAEYLYVDLGSASVTGFFNRRSDGLVFPNTHGTDTWHTQENIVRAGVNYHFN
jgi:outer membrane immunogenic protein